MSWQWVVLIVAGGLLTVWAITFAFFVGAFKKAWRFMDET